MPGCYTQDKDKPPNAGELIREAAFVERYPGISGSEMARDLEVKYEMTLPRGVGATLKAAKVETLATHASRGKPFMTSSSSSPIR
jgi:hypothetical protein